MKIKSESIFLLLILILSTSQFVMHSDAQPIPSTLASGIDLEVDFGNGTIVLFSNLEGTDVLAVTNGSLGIVVEWYGNLAYVTSIDGVSNNQLDLAQMDNPQCLGRHPIHSYPLARIAIVRSHPTRGRTKSHRTC